MPPSKPPLELALIPPSHVNAVWPLCDAFLRAACEDNEWSADEIREAAVRGDVQLWFASNEQQTEAAAATRIVSTPTGKVLLVLAMGGRGIARWLGLLDEIELWAKAQGCIISRIVGRRGWSRVLHDYKQTRIILDKRL